MSAKVTILSDRQEDVLQIPLTAVIRKDGQSFCLVRKAESSLSLQPIEIGTPNLMPFSLADCRRVTKWW